MAKSIQIVGPFITNYSLARVNRGVGVALAELYPELDVAFYQEEDRLDKIPDENDSKNHPKAYALWQKERKESDVVIYNDSPKTGMTPHGLKNLPGKIKLLYLAWEETVYPKEWVEEINEHAHGILTISSFVKQILEDNGVRVPIKTALIGMDDSMRTRNYQRYPLKTDKKIKFLHISTARMRKGVDVLLKAYFETFTKDDDVCLVIKSFPSPDNIVDEMLNTLSTPDSPAVEHIYSPDLTDQDLANLIRTCDVGVYPSRAEGFGLPIAESMFHERPVIATNYSGYLDFANEDNAFLIDYKLKDTTKSEAVNIGAKWAEPDQDQLTETMRQLYEALRAKDDKRPNEGGGQLRAEGRKLIEKKVTLAKAAVEPLTWKNAAKEVMDFIDEVEQYAHLKEKKLAVITPYNSEDGIADYSENLYQSIINSFYQTYILSNKDIADRTAPDPEFVRRTWNQGEADFSETIAFIEDNSIDTVHIQYHSGFHYPVSSLDTLIEELQKMNKKVFVTLHQVRGKGFDIPAESKSLAQADLVFVHNDLDVEYLKSFSISTELFFHPRVVYKKRTARTLKKQLGLQSYSPVILTHGFLTQKNNLSVLVRAIKQLKNEYPDIMLISLNAVSANNAASSAEFEKAQAVVAELKLDKHVLFIPDFLSPEQIEIITQVADLHILPYNDVGESGSGAVSKLLASQKPTIVPDIEQFAEFTNEVIKMNPLDEMSNSGKVNEIAKTIKNVLTSKTLQKETTTAAATFIQKHSYAAMSRILLAKYA